MMVFLSKWMKGFFDAINRGAIEMVGLGEAANAYGKILHTDHSQYIGELSLQFFEDNCAEKETT